MRTIGNDARVALLAGATMLGAVAHGVAPTTFLDKVTCTGAQYVDTGLLPDKNLRAVVTLSTTDTSHDKMVFGERNAGFNFLCWFGKTAGTSITPCIGSSPNISGKSTGKAAGEKWTFDFSANGISADETEVFSASTLSGYITDATSAKTLLLFGLSDNGKVDSRKFYGDCYRAKFYSGAKLVRDLAPCLDAEGVACFYNFAYDSADAATGNEYYYSATATAFVAGEVVAPVIDATASYSYLNGNINVSFACKRVSTSVCKTIKAVVKDSVSSSEVILAEDVATVEGVTKSIPVDLAKAPFDISVVYQSSDGQTLDTLVLGTNITIDTVSVTATQASLTALGEVGEFVISLPDGVTNDTDVEVNYTMGGTAVNGTDYVTLSGKATIPAGEESIAVSVRQSSNCDATAVKDVTITL